MLRIGRIDYLNVWPLFQGLESMIPSMNGVRTIADHPAKLNALLAAGDLDLAPSSSFEYLAHAEQYELLADLSISSDGPVQSVILAVPFDPEQMPRHVARGRQVGLTSASASAAALLRILWRFYWHWPEPAWTAMEPGQGLKHGAPFLEIGDAALQLTCTRPPGWRLLDLGAAWKELTGLPFVFGVWMVKKDLDAQAEKTLNRVVEALHASRRRFMENPMAWVYRYERPAWMSAEVLTDYWQCIRYDFGPGEQAGLVLFGEYARQLNLVSSVPGLRWKTLPEQEEKHDPSPARPRFALRAKKDVL